MKREKDCKDVSIMSPQDEQRRRTSLLCLYTAYCSQYITNNIIVSARVYFMKRVKDCKDGSIMSPQDEQRRRTSLLFLYTAIFLFY